MKVQSTFIKEVQFGKLSSGRILTIIFNNGYVAHYIVTADFDYDEFINSESIGSYYHKHIKGKYVAYTTDEYNNLKAELLEQEKANSLSPEEKLLEALRTEEENLLNEFLQLKADYEQKITAIALEKEQLISQIVKNKLNA